MNVKNIDFVAFTQYLLFSNKHKICSGRELIWPKSPLPTPKTINSQTKIFKMNDMKPKRKQKKEINEGEMQIASVSRKKIISNLHWDNWPTYLTTTTVVLIVLQKRNYFRAFVNRQEMQ